MTHLWIPTKGRTGVKSLGFLFGAMAGPWAALWTYLFYAFKTYIVE